MLLCVSHTQQAHTLAAHRTRLTEIFPDSTPAVEIFARVVAATSADRLAPASRIARASESVTLAADPSPIRRFRPLPPVSSVNRTVPLLLS